MEGLTPPVPVAIALGSNLGDRRGHLVWAIEALDRHLADTRVSALIETEPVDVPGPQPPYLNAVLVGTTRLEAEPLLALLMSLEAMRGRRRPVPKAPRVLDLDLILYGDRVIASPSLTVPHRAFRDRHFVLEPLNEIAPDWIDPVTGLTVGTLLARLTPRAG